MEKRHQEETVEGSRSHQPALTGNLALKNFTIPRKKRTSGEVHLERCSEDSREYGLIQTKLSDSKLDTRNDRANSWVWKDVYLVHNEELLKKFSEKRAQMRAKGRHGREMEERFCFLAASDEMAAQIYQHGLQVGGTVQHALGKPSHGVYLYRHVDVALKSTTGASKMFIFKVLYGKVKKIAPSLDWNKTQDPTLAFDCHMCKDAVSYRDTPHQQELGSTVFLFDFNEKQELRERPRQCLPYAVVSYVPASSAIMTVPVGLPLTPSTLPFGQVHDRFKACTVAERRRKGNTATVTFKHFGIPGCFEMDYTPQNPRVEAPFRKTDMQKTLKPKQHWITASEQSFSSSVPVMDPAALPQSFMGKNTYLSSQKQNTSSMHEQKDDKLDTVPQSPLDKISTIVYSSRLVRDPRLSRQESNQPASCSKAEATDTSSACDTTKCHSALENQKDHYGFAGNTCDSKEPSNTDEKDAQRDFPLKSSNNDECVHATKLPSMKLFKMKFQKYAAYFKMDEVERHQKIWSQENMSAEEKQELADRIQFYYGYYQKYKKGLLFPKVIETKASSLCQSEHSENHNLETKGNTYKQNPQHEVAASLSDNTDFANMDKGNGNTAEMHTTKHPDHQESNTVMLRKTQDDGDHPISDKCSEQYLLLGSLNLNLSDEKTDPQSVQFDLKHPSPLTSPSNEAKLNCSIEELSRSLKEDLQKNESTPGVNSIEMSNNESFPTYENNSTIMDIGNCVEVSSCGTSDNNLSSCVAVKQNQNDTSCSDEEMDYRVVKCCENSETSLELEMETVVQENIAHNELYKRLQVDQLLPSENQKHVFSPKAYLKPRVMGRPADTISKPTNESKEHTKTETNQDLLVTVTLKAERMSANMRETLSLSERFSEIKSLQKRLNKGNKIIKIPLNRIRRSEGHKESATSNAELVQLLSQRYRKSKKYVKSNRFSRPGSHKKQHGILSRRHFLKRSKYIKKKRFWKANNNFSRKIASFEGPHETGNRKATSDSSISLSHTSEIILTECKNDSQSNSHTSDADSDKQLLHIPSCQEAIGSKLQDNCCQALSVISKDLPQPLEFNTKEKPVNPTEQLSEDVSEKDFTSHPVIVAEVEQVKTTENSSNQTEASMITCISKDYRSIAECKEESMLLKVTPETQLNKEHLTVEKVVDNSGDDSESLRILDSKKETLSDIPASNTNTTELQTNMTPEAKVMETINDTAETATIECPAQNESKTSTLNPQHLEGRECNITTMNQSCLNISTNTSTGSSTDTEVHEDSTSDSKQRSPGSLKCASSNIVDLTIDDPALSCQSEDSSEQTKSSKTHLLSDTKSLRNFKLKGDCELLRPEQNKNDANSPETQLISKLRDYLTKFESTVKKQESVNENLKERPVVWITLDSTAHKQQLFEKGQYCMVNLPYLMPNETDIVTKDSYNKSSVQSRNVPQSEHVPIGNDVCLVVPVESKRGRRSSQTRRSTRQRSTRSSVVSVSPDSTSALDIVKSNSPCPESQINDQSTCSQEIATNDTVNPQFQMQKEKNTSQQNCSVNLHSPREQKIQENHSLHPIDITDDGNVSSTFADNEYSISDISNTLKMADQTASLAELGSLQSKCKNMLQHFISSFERDQKMPFDQSFISRYLILEKYLDHPPSQVDLKYEAVNSYLELQMMMEAWQFVENKMNFLTGKPTFRSLLWYDPSLYGELYKGEVGFQQQSSLFASFQKSFAQEGYAKLQEYHSAVSSLHQQLQMAPEASYYMYLKSKRELLEAEAALRNPHDIKSFFLSVPVAAMINFGDNLERLEKVHKVIMTFVETPSDQLPGTFDVGKAEHLSITCRYLQEKSLFMKSCKEMRSKVSWFGIEHLLYDASKVLIWQDMGHGVPSEVLKIYKNSNPQIIFGVTESGVTLVNKVQQPPTAVDGAVMTAKKNYDAARKRRRIQSWMSTQSSVAQNTNEDQDQAYKRAKRRRSHPPVAQCDLNNKGVNPPFQTTSSTRVENPSPFYAFPQRLDPGHWGMVGSGDWKTFNAVPPSMSHAHSKRNSHLLPKRRGTLSHSDERRSLADIHKPQWPSVAVPQATLQGDSCVTHPGFESVKYQQTNTAAHCPVLSQEQVNQFNLAMTQPYSLPACPLNPGLVPPPPLSVQALTHAPMPSTITTIHYPYFLLNGQTYTTGSTADIRPDARYYPNTI